MAKLCSRHIERSKKNKCDLMWVRACQGARSQAVTKKKIAQQIYYTFNMMHGTGFHSQIGIAPMMHWSMAVVFDTMNDIAGKVRACQFHPCQVDLRRLFPWAATQRHTTMMTISEVIKYVVDTTDAYIFYILQVLSLAPNIQGFRHFTSLSRSRMTLQWHSDGSLCTRFNFPYHFMFSGSLCRWCVVGVAIFGTSTAAKCKIIV